MKRHFGDEILNIILMYPVRNFFFFFFQIPLCVFKSKRVYFPARRLAAHSLVNRRTAMCLLCVSLKCFLDGTQTSIWRTFHVYDRAAFFRSLTHAITFFRSVNHPKFHVIFLFFWTDLAEVQQN